jgi:hypothetical protein
MVPRDVARSPRRSHASSRQAPRLARRRGLTVAGRRPPSPAVPSRPMRRGHGRPRGLIPDHPGRLRIEPLKQRAPTRRTMPIEAMPPTRPIDRRRRRGPPSQRQSPPHQPAKPEAIGRWTATACRGGCHPPCRRPPSLLRPRVAPRPLRWRNRTGLNVRPRPPLPLQQPHCHSRTPVQRRAGRP